MRPGNQVPGCWDVLYFMKINFLFYTAQKSFLLLHVFPLMLAFCGVSKGRRMHCCETVYSFLFSWWGGMLTLVGNCKT